MFVSPSTGDSIKRHAPATDAELDSIVNLLSARPVRPSATPAAPTSQPPPPTSQGPHIQRNHSTPTLPVSQPGNQYAPSHQRSYSNNGNQLQLTSMHHPNPTTNGQYHQQPSRYMLPHNPNVFAPIPSVEASLRLAATEQEHRSRDVAAGVMPAAMEQYLEYMRAMTAIQQQNPGHHSNLPKPASFDDAETLHSRVMKTNTWPMRPNRDSGVPANAGQVGADGGVAGMTATDLEFSQYVDAIQRKSARSSARARGSGDSNPWSVGDSAMAWPPFGVNFDGFVTYCLSN